MTRRNSFITSVTVFFESSDLNTLETAVVATLIILDSQNIDPNKFMGAMDMSLREISERQYGT